MLRDRHRWPTCSWSTPALCTLVLAVVAAGCTSDPQATPVPTTVDAADAAQAAGQLTVKIGTIVNTNAPTADRDLRLTEVLAQATDLATSGAAVTLEVMTIDGVDDVESTVSALAGRGVTVIAALCDDASVPQIVDAALEQGMLAVTACVTLPKPNLGQSSPMFFDLAGLHETPSAIVDWVKSQGAEGISTIGSDLLPDVANSCHEVERALAAAGVSLDASVTFTELVDEPPLVVEGAASTLIETDALVLCALPPTASDMVTALRTAGFAQPVVVPWFAETENWPNTASDVFTIVPASRHGDDPAPAVVNLFESVGDTAQAVDVVSADTVALLANAAELARSPGSSRLADALSSDGRVAAFSGDLSIDQDRRVSERSYRVIEISNGTPEFSELIAPTG